MQAKSIKYIVIHCSAGYGDLNSIKNFWFNVRKWRTGGYHRFVDFDGAITKLYPFDKVVNGVLDHNHE